MRSDTEIELARTRARVAAADANRALMFMAIKAGVFLAIPMIAALIAVLVGLR